MHCSRFFNPVILYFILLQLVPIQVIFSQNTCATATDLTSNIVVNGSYEYSVDNSGDVSQYFEITAPQDGWVAMTTCIVAANYNTYLKVYNSSCELIGENGSFCSSRAAYHLEVVSGERYIFEWSPEQLLDLDDATYTAKMVFEESITGQYCDEPATLQMGENTSDYWMGLQYYSYVATADGVLEINTCDYSIEAEYVEDTQIFNICEGSALTAELTYCNGEDWPHTLSYNITDGEEVIVAMKDLTSIGTYEDYRFDASFTPVGGSCENSIVFNTPDIYDVAHINLENDNDQWYKFTAPKTGSATITTKVPSLASSAYLSGSSAQTHIKIYNACDGDLIEENKDYAGYFGGSRIDFDLTADTEYYILMIDKDINDPYQFEIFYEEDLIIGTEEAPIEAVLDYNATFADLHYINTQWFSYEFTESGEFHVELSSYYGNINTWTTFTANQEIFIEEDEDTGTPGGFNFSATAGDELKFSLNGIASNTFMASFEEEPCREEFTEILEGDWSTTLFASNGEADHVFRFTAPSDGALIVSSCSEFTSGDTYVKLFSECSSELIAESDDACGTASRMVTDVEEGVTYDLVWDATKIIEAEDFGEFEFYFGYLADIDGQTQASSIAVDVGQTYFTETNLIDEQWYVYTLPNDGRVTVDEQQVDAITFDLISEEGGLIENIAPVGLVYTGLAGDKVFIVWETDGFDYTSSNFNLTFYEKDVDEDIVVLTETACDSYQFYEELLTSSGQYVGEYVNDSDADSLVILNLTILESNSGSQEVSSCDTYDWEGTAYISSGEYYETLTNEAGCDSLATLILTILDSDKVNEEATACDFYEFNGETLTESGDYEYRYTNQSGCDSLVNLSLLIHPSDKVTTEVSACNSYEFDGSLLTSSGEYTATFTNEVSCDSLVTLTLTILESDETNTKEEACGSYTFDNEELLESGDYTATFTNQSGCDSLVNLTLTILEEPSDVIELNGVILFAEDQVDVTYQWFDCDTGEDLEGETKRQLTPKRAGFYAVAVTNDHCTVTSVCMDSDGEVLGFHDLQVLIKAYPNPTQSNIEIDLGDYYYNVEIDVMTITGHVIGYTSESFTNKIAVDLGERKGVYFIRVISAGESLKTLRVIKE